MLVGSTRASFTTPTIELLDFLQTLRGRHRGGLDCRVHQACRDSRVGLEDPDLRAYQGAPEWAAGLIMTSVLTLKTN